MMIVINLVVIASYIVWKPSEGNYYEALQRGKWLLSAGYFFAWLAAQIVVCELHYVYTSYRPVVFNSNDQDIGNGVINDNINTDQIQLEYSTTSVFVLVHGLGFILQSVFMTWLTVTHIEANIVILALIILFPTSVYFVNKLQSSFDEYTRTIIK